MADVTLTYKGDTILELSASGQKSIDTQGFYCDANILLNYVKPSGGSIQYASGSYTPTQDYTAEENCLITDITTIGFTPKLFLFFVDKVADVSGVSGAVLETLYHNNGTSNHYRTTVRYSNTNNTRSGHAVGTSWTTQSSFYLYLNDGNIYYRTYSASGSSTKFILKGNVKYDWIAFAW